MMEALPKQNDKPATVFIFGAGAAYADGVLLQAEIIPTILRDRDPQLKKSPLSKRLRKFLTRNFSHGDRCPSLEEVFGFINFFVANDLSLSKDCRTSELFQLKADLTKVIHYLISRSTRESKNFTSFWNTICTSDPEIGVITTNYDTLLDDAFDKIYPRCLLDYCIELANYRHAEDIIPFDWWIDPKKPTTIHDEVVPTRIKLIKLHGSLNWKYCNCCGQVGLTPWQHGIDLKQDSFQSFLSIQTSECPFDGNKLSSLIQVPTHFKATYNYIFNKLYDEASYLVGNAKQLVFVGYSFPEADVHIRALVRRCFAENGRIVVINKSRTKELKHRYESLSKYVEYHEMMFEHFVRSKTFTDILAANKTLQPMPRFARRIRAPALDHARDLANSGETP